MSVFILKASIKARQKCLGKTAKWNWLEKINVRLESYLLLEKEREDKLQAEASDAEPAYEAWLILVEPVRL